LTRSYTGRPCRRTLGWSGIIGKALGEVLVFGVGVALSPLAIVVVVVMLVAPGGTRPVWPFAAAWVLSLALGCTLVLLLADDADASSYGEPATWVSVLKIVVGLLPVMFAVSQWPGRESHADTEAPVWMRKLDGITATKAASLLPTLAPVIGSGSSPGTRGRPETPGQTDWREQRRFVELPGVRCPKRSSGTDVGLR
jgi:hypothetical protein